jgi:hypothetical protein
MPPEDGRRTNFQTIVVITTNIHMVDKFQQNNYVYDWRDLEGSDLDPLILSQYLLAATKNVCKPLSGD